MKNVKIYLPNWLSRQKNIPQEIQGKITDETEKAIKLEYNYATVTVWLPKSQIVIESLGNQEE